MSEVSAHDVDVFVQNGWASRLEYAAIAIPGSGVHYVGMTTGDLPVLVLDRAFATTADSCSFQFYRASPWTNGVNALGQIRNRNDLFWGRADRAPLAAAAGGVTPNPALSAANLMSSLTLTIAKRSTSVGSNGITIVLAPSTSYVLAITNNDAAPKDADFAALLVRYGMDIRK